MDSVFQAGIILGRITQLCVERGVVSTNGGIALEDLILLFTEELSSLPASASTRITIADEIHNLTAALAEYGKDQRLNAEDARIMISLVSHWTDMLLDDFIDNSQSASTAMIPPETSRDSSQKESGASSPPHTDHENQDSNHSIHGDTQEIISGSHERLIDRE